MCYVHGDLYNMLSSQLQERLIQSIDDWPEASACLMHTQPTIDTILVLFSIQPIASTNFLFGFGIGK